MEIVGALQARLGNSEELNVRSMANYLVGDDRLWDVAATGAFWNGGWRSDPFAT